MKFLPETDGSVQKQQSTDDTKVDPILETGSENGSSLDLWSDVDIRENADDLTSMTN